MDRAKIRESTMKTIEEFRTFLRGKGLFYEIEDYSSQFLASMTVSIRWGDWKHDHLYFKHLLKEFFGEDVIFGSKLTEEDGTDAYSADYFVKLPLAVA